MFLVGIGMNVAGIPQDGSDKCGIPAGMDIIMAETPWEWSANLAVTCWHTGPARTKCAETLSLIHI